MDALVAARLELTPPLDRDPADVARGGKKFVPKVNPLRGLTFHKGRGQWMARLMAGGVRRQVWCATREEAAEVLAWLKATYGHLQRGPHGSALPKAGG
jgi:hypothetical protein